MWIARDKSGCLHLFSEMPKRHSSCGLEYWKVDTPYSTIALDDDAFSNVKWDDEPMKVLVLPMPTPVMVTNWMSEIPPHCRVCSHCHCMQPKGQEACEYYNERVEYLNKQK